MRRVSYIVVVYDIFISCVKGLGKIVVEDDENYLVFGSFYVVSGVLLSNSSFCGIIL